METIKNTLAQFQTSQGLQLRATIKRLSRHQIVFEVYHPSEVIRLSESLDDFKNFMRASQHAYHVTPEFKLAVADMQILLQDMRQWFDQAEISVQSLPTG